MTTRGKETVDFIKDRSQTVTTLMPVTSAVIRVTIRLMFCQGHSFAHVSDDNFSRFIKRQLATALVAFCDCDLQRQYLTIGKVVTKRNLAFVSSLTPIVLISVTGHVIKIY